MLDRWFWVNEAERWDWEQGYMSWLRLWTSHSISPAISIWVYEGGTLSWKLRSVMSYDLPGTHLSSGFAVDSSPPNWSKHAKTHLIIWESLEVLMPLNTVFPNPGLSTSWCLYVSQIIATLAISNNLIHFKVQGGEKKYHRNQPITCGRR